MKDITHRIRVSGLRLSEAAMLLDTPQSDLLLALAGKFQSFRAAELRTWRDRLGNPVQ